MFKRFSGINVTNMSNIWYLILKIKQTKNEKQVFDAKCSNSYLLYALKSNE